MGRKKSVKIEDDIGDIEISDDELEEAIKDASLIDEDDEEDIELDLEDDDLEDEGDEGDEDLEDEEDKEDEEEPARKKTAKKKPAKKKTAKLSNDELLVLGNVLDNKDGGRVKITKEIMAQVERFNIANPGKHAIWRGIFTGTFIYFQMTEAKAKAKAKAEAEAPKTTPSKKKHKK